MLPRPVHCSVSVFPDNDTGRYVCPDGCGYDGDGGGDFDNDCDFDGDGGSGDGVKVIYEINYDQKCKWTKSKSVFSLAAGMHW